MSAANAVPVVFKITPRHGPRRKHRPSVVVELFYRAVA
jgi:hypothetical protein